MNPRPDPVRDERRRRCAPMLAAARANGERQAAVHGALYDMKRAAARPWGGVAGDVAAALRIAAKRAVEETRDDEDLDRAALAIRDALAQVGAA